MFQEKRATLANEKLNTMKKWSGNRGPARQGGHRCWETVTDKKGLGTSHSAHAAADPRRKTEKQGQALTIRRPNRNQTKKKQKKKGNQTQRRHTAQGMLKIGPNSIHGKARTRWRNRGREREQIKKLITGRAITCREDVTPKTTEGEKERAHEPGTHAQPRRLRKHTSNWEQPDTGSAPQTKKEDVSKTRKAL